MQVCPNCSHQNRIGIVFCEQCGASLIGDAPLATKNIGSRMLEGWRKTTNDLGSDVFKAGTMVRLEVEGADPILLKSKKEMAKVDYYVCVTCGNTIEGEPTFDKCPICGAPRAQFFKAP